MRITCPNCASGYDVPDDAIGPNGRKVRCRACGTSWQQAGPAAVSPESEGDDAPVITSAPTVADAVETVEPTRATVAPATMPPIVEPAVEERPAKAARPPRRRLAIRGPVVALGLVVLVMLLGGAIALIAYGPGQVATGLGLSDRRVPLGIAITRQPDWRMIAGGSELFAVSGRIWNPTQVEQPVPDIHAELKDNAGRVVYAWTITRPQPRIGPGKAIDFDAAAVDVPRNSAKVAVSFVGTDGGK